MRRILITGAGGFVGRHLTAALSQAWPGAILLTEPFDVRDGDATIEAVRMAAPDACVHLAAISAIPAAREDPDQAWDVNLRGTLNIARAIMAAAPDCVFLYPSSADTYGASFRAGHALDETAPLAPLNTYGATKAAADLALGALAAEGLRAFRVRPFNHTGPGQTAHFAVPAFARQLALIGAGRQSPVMRVGALDPFRDFLDVRDVCAGYVACLQQADRLPAGVILNLASGVPRRIGDVLASMVRLSGVHASLETDTSRLRPTDIPTATGDAAKARALLGWSPRIEWDTTLADVIADWRQRIVNEA